MDKSKKKKVIIISVAVVIILALIITMVLKPKTVDYDEEVARTQDIATYYNFEGNIEAQDSQTVYSRNFYPVKKFYVSEGNLVKKGDLLYELENNSLQSNLTQAQASVTSARVSANDAKLNLDRMSALFNEGATPAQSYEQAKSSYEIANAQLTQASANYDMASNNADDSKIKAEIDGEVTNIYVDENDSVATGTMIMDIVNFDYLKVLVKVDEFDLTAVTEGKEVSVSVKSLDKTVAGKVSKVSKQAEVLNGVSYFTAEIDLEKNADLRVGLSVEVNIANKSAKGATTISMKALQFDNENQPFVYYKDQSNKVVQKYVKIGINNGITIQILDGIKPGETILLPKNIVTTADPFAPMNNAGEDQSNGTSE